MLRNLSRQLSRAVDQSTELASAFHQGVLYPVFTQVNKLIWGEKRTEELHEFNPDAEMSLEEQLVDIGLVAATSSTALAVGGYLFSPTLGLLSVPGLLIGSIPVYKNAIDAWQDEGKVTNNSLAAIIQTLLILHGSLLFGNLTPLAYFSSKKFNHMAKRRFEQKLVNILTAQQSMLVRVISADTTETPTVITSTPIESQKPLNALTKGEIVVIYAGEMIPVDGTITEGVGMIDERALTGESQPVEKGAGAAVFAATVLLSGKLYIQVESSGQESIIGQVETILQQTFYHTPSRELWAQTLTDKLALPTLIASGVTLPMLGVAGASALIDSHPLYRLAIAGNASLISFLNITSQENVLVKDGRVLEGLETVDTFIFDKTGTLTEDQPQVGEIHTFGHYTDHDILFYAAMAEQKQSHPIAAAIIAAAKSHALDYPSIENLEYKLGLGLRLHWGEQLVHVGSARFMEMEEVALSAAATTLIDQSRTQGLSLVFVAIDSELIGAIELHTVARAHAAAFIRKLQKHPQVQSVMIISGDQAAPTQRIAQELGITDYYAEAFPEDKAALIKALQEQGHKVCFVGDGINDAIALKQADVSISLRGASPLATSTAQIVLLEDNLELVQRLYDLAHQFEINQKNTMATVLGSSVLCLWSVLFWHVKLNLAILITTGGFLTALGISLQPWLKYRQEIALRDRPVSAPLASVVSALPPTENHAQLVPEG